MNWYLAKMIYRITCGDGHHQPQFDEQLRLLQAHSREEAVNKARLFGIQEEESFFNQQQQLVRWAFINISEIYSLDGLVDGAEIYSRIEEPENAEHYLHTIRMRAEQLLYTETFEWLNQV